MPHWTVGEPLLAVDDVLRPGVALLRQERGEDTALTGHGVDGVLHHGELARGDRTERRVATPGDADGVLDLRRGQLEHASRDEGRHEGGQGRVMPSPLADSGVGRLAEAHLELVAQRDAQEEVAAGAGVVLGGGHRGGDDVRGMGRILLPVDVVVVHDPDHQGVGQ
jgi:hypothetical protein